MGHPRAPHKQPFRDFDAPHLLENDLVNPLVGLPAPNPGADGRAGLFEKAVLGGH
ncbi:hypothetical protein Ate02nite_86210 [Paractinoplanes tereljensis]|uniref:Uncharacterized protein n=1 Tax=Paractinoplanes tereljensis TaxID=571912 RepID=A0A919NV88_9ACTN|nr:hypothetical protein Ate02nite_86210 [Actinoplanes tereljensis]